jgi:hypothetical protein
MASGGKKKTTMAKLMRESRQRERRQDKLARKEARKLGLTAEPDGADVGEQPLADHGELAQVAATSGDPAAEQPDGI